jgi:hypothetical protein
MHSKAKAFAAASAAALWALAAAPALAQGGIIAVETLPTLDSWAANGLNRGEPGLPQTLWIGSDARALGAAFDRLERPLGSPAAQGLARRALLSPGVTPAGNARDAEVKRFAALARLGLVEALPSMVAGRLASDPLVAQFVAQAELAQAQTDAACARARALQGDGLPAFVLRLRAFCFAKTGDGTAAGLTLDLARGPNPPAPGAEERWWTQAVSTLSGAGGPKPTGRFGDVLTASVSLESGLAPGAIALSASSAQALIRLARDGSTPPDLRLGAASQALRFGLIDPATAGDAIGAALAAPPAKGRAAPAIPALAQGYAAVQSAGGDEDRLLALAAALRAAGGAGGHVAAARLYRNDLLRARPTSSDAAPALARALLLLGDANAARGWVDASAGARTEAALGAALAAAGLADPGLAIARRVDSAVNAAIARRAARDIAALSALGAPLTDAAAAMTTRADPAARRADPVLLAQLVSASQQGAVGETAILAAAALGEGAHTLDPGSLTSIIQALRAVGLDADARKVAVEAILADLSA